MAGVVAGRPPRVSFKWRHWGKMTGRLQCPLSNGMTLLAKPTMEEHGMTGCALAWLGAGCRMEKLEVFFDQQQPMASMVRHQAQPPSTADTTSPTTVPPGPAPPGPRPPHPRSPSTGQPGKTSGPQPSGAAKVAPAAEAPARDPVRGLARGMLSLFTPRGKGT